MSNIGVGWGGSPPPNLNIDGSAATPLPKLVNLTIKPKFWFPNSAKGLTSGWEDFAPMLCINVNIKYSTVHCTRVTMCPYSNFSKINV